MRCVCETRENNRPGAVTSFMWHSAQRCVRVLTTQCQIVGGGAVVGQLGCGILRRINYRTGLTVCMTPTSSGKFI